MTNMVKIALLLIMSTIRTKQEAIRIFGGTMKAVGDALGISRQAVYQWPEDLPQDTSDRLVGAAIRLKLLPPGLSDSRRRRNRAPSPQAPEPERESA